MDTLTMPDGTVVDVEAANEAFTKAMGAPVPGEEPGAVSKWKMTEAQLLAEVSSRCERLGISWIHFDNAHHNKRVGNLIGFVDLFLCGRGGVAFRELKREGHSLRPAQTTRKYRLRAAGQDWDIWEPSDLASGRIDRELAALSSTSTRKAAQA